MPYMNKNNLPVLIYSTEDGVTQLEVQMDGDTVWLSTAQMAELFQRERSVITKHIKNILERGAGARAMCNFCTLQITGEG